MSMRQRNILFSYCAFPGPQGIPPTPIIHNSMLESFSLDHQSTFPSDWVLGEPPEHINELKKCYRMVFNQTFTMPPMGQDSYCHFRTAMPCTYLEIQGSSLHCCCLILALRELRIKEYMKRQKEKVGIALKEANFLSVVIPMKEQMQPIKPTICKVD